MIQDKSKQEKHFMWNEKFQTRRQFISQLFLLLGCQSFGSKAFAYPDRSKVVLKSSPNPKITKISLSSANYTVAPWKGDDPTIGHKFREGNFPLFPDKSEKIVDFIIVGGGMAGLTTGHILKDHDFLLLEQYGELGGQSRGGSYHDIAYSYGPAYLGEPDEFIAQLISSCGLTLTELDTNRNGWYFEKHWLSGLAGKEQSSFYKEFANLLTQSQSIYNKLPTLAGFQLGSSSSLSNLDNTLFIDCLQGYSQQFLALLNSYYKSAFCGSIDQISAAVGYSLLKDLTVPAYVFKGGNPALARALRQKIQSTGNNRALLNTFVWKIEINTNGATAYFTDSDNNPRRIDCRHVIVATPPYVAARQLNKVDNMVKAMLLKFKFGSYLVANLLMKKKLFSGAYDSYVSSPFSFTDMITAEAPYMMTNSYKSEMGSVLTVYQPYSPGSAGRPLLLAGDKETIAGSVVDEIKQLIPDLSSNLEEIVLARWGHALALIEPAYFARLDNLHKAITGPYSLAHSSVYGLPAAESAIAGARNAAKRALAIATKPVMVVP